MEIVVGFEALDRTLSLIEQLAAASGGLGVLRMAELTGLAPSTVHRYLAALQERGVVEKGRDRCYRLTPRLYLLGLPAWQGLDLEVQAQPVLERLAARSRETACLMVRDGRHSVCVAQIDSRHPLQIAARVGRRQDLRVGATSRVLLAFAPDDVRQEILGLEPSPRHTANTVTDPAALARILGQIRQDGYYVSKGELDEGVVAVAAPVRDHQEEVIAAIALAAPESRAGDEILAGLVDLVVEEAATLSRKLGFPSVHVHARERSLA